MTIKSLTISKNFFYPLILIVLIFMPKIDLVSVPGYRQGVRIEDLFFLFFTAHYLLNYKEIFLKSNYQFKSILIFISYFFFSNFIGYYSNLPIMSFGILRFFEYIILIIFLNNLNVTGLFLKRIIFTYIALNFFIVILQYFDLVGSFSSLGYLSSGHAYNARAYGLTGGSWELGVVSSISFLIFLKFEENKMNIFITFLFTLVLIILSEARGSFIAFFTTIIFIYITTVSFRNILLTIMAFAFLAFLINYLNINYLNINYVINTTDQNLLHDVSRFLLTMSDFDYAKIIELLKNFILYNEVPPRYILMQTHPDLLSLLIRLNFWSTLYNEFNTSIFTQLFGTGFTRIYTESLLIRIWFATGYVGIILLICLIKDMKVYQLIFFVLVGFTLDIFISFKIVLLALLLNIRVKKSDENSN